MRRKFFLLLGILLFSIAPACLAVSDTQVRIGVLAKRGPEAVLSQWRATAEYLDETIPEYEFRVIPLGFDEIITAVEHQEIDFVLSNSAFYVRLEHPFGVTRIATLKNLRQGAPYTVFGGVLFTRADREDITTLEHLRDNVLMAVEQSSLGGFIMAMGEMHRAGINAYRDLKALSFGGTHDAVVYAVERIYGKTTLETLLSETEIKQFLPNQRSPKTLEMISKILGEQSVMSASLSPNALGLHEQMSESARVLMDRDRWPGRSRMGR